MLIYDICLFTVSSTISHLVWPSGNPPELLLVILHHRDRKLISTPECSIYPYHSSFALFIICYTGHRVKYVTFKGMNFLTLKFWPIYFIIMLPLTLFFSIKCSTSKTEAKMEGLALWIIYISFIMQFISSFYL